MSGELRHKDVGSELTKVEWEGVDTHYIDSGVEGDILYRDATGKLVRLLAGDPGLPLVSQGPSAAPAYQALTDTGIAANIPRPNLFDNPGFEVWQRGTGPFTGAGYFADRWKLDVGGGASPSITRITSTIGTGGYSLQAVISGGPTYYVQLIQRTEFGSLNPGLVAGKAVTFACKVKATATYKVRLSLEDGVGYAWSTYNATTGEETLSVTLNVDAVPTDFLARITINAACTVEINDAVLVIGAAAPTYYPLHPAEEWVRCLRFYEVHGGGNTYGPVVSGYASAGSEIIRSNVAFAIPKMFDPVVSKNGTWAVTNCGQPSTSKPSMYGYVLSVSSSAAGQCLSEPNSSDDTITAEVDL